MNFEKIDNNNNLEKSKENASFEQEIDKEVKKLDPLNLDDFFKDDLPGLNESRSLDKILNKLTEITSERETIRGMNYKKSLASTRDIGMIAASAVRHGAEISRDAYEAEQVLILLSQNTGEVPRDSVFSYGPRNPDGERLRTFTSDPQERIFIESFVEGMSGLDATIYNLVLSSDVELNDSEFVDFLNKASESFQSMVSGVVRTKKQVDPKFFYEHLRPYFPPIKIGGKTYMAPGGAQMPVLLVDDILWGANVNDSTYRDYYSDNIKYLPPYYKEVMKKFKGPSIVSRISHFSDDNLKKITDEEIKRLHFSINAVLKMFRQLQKFRISHRRMADKSFNDLREKDDVGSGGYTNEILSDLENLMMANKEKIKKIKEDLK